MKSRNRFPAENEHGRLLIYWDQRDIEYNGTLITGNIPQHYEEVGARFGSGITFRFVVRVISVDSLDYEINDLHNLGLLHHNRIQRSTRRDPGGIAEGFGLIIRKHENERGLFVIS